MELWLLYILIRQKTFEFSRSFRQVFVQIVQKILSYIHTAYFPHDVTQAMAQIRIRVLFELVDLYRLAG